MRSRGKTPRARSFLLVPAGGAGDGIGHLSRCLRLAAGLHADVTVLAARLDSASRALLRRAAGKRAGTGRPRVAPGLTPGSRWDLILLDGRRTSKAELSVLQKRGPVVCLDEGGEAREYASYLIDALPGPAGRSPANVSSPGFLDLPARLRRPLPGTPRSVLVSFGGEDRENLSGRLLDALIGNGFFSPQQITVVEGPLFGARQWPRGTRVLRGVQRLAAVLHHHDLVFTHFGMTCFEALASGVPVILLNPSRYHALLAGEAGIADIGVGAPDLKALRRLLHDPRALAAAVESFNERIGRKRTGRLAAHLRTLCAQGQPRCPICGKDGNRVIARFPDRTYRECGRCGMTYMESFSSRPVRYDAAYFGSEYEAQYGRTYLQDFDSIKALARRRLAVLRSIAGRKAEGALVDVGCALGPFLDAAREQGLACFGLDVSSDAVNHVTRKLGIPALCASFEDVERRQLPRKISAVTMWWVIEHFRDTDLVLRKVAALLPPGGVFAFSTPNARGVSARKNLAAFLQESPPDHYTILSPRGLGRLLAGYGLELRAVRVTGHHPERFPGLLGKAASSSRAAGRFLRAASRILRLGDTFEAYAVKVEQT